MLIESDMLKNAEAVLISYAQYGGELEVKLSAGDLPIADGEEIAKFKIKAENDFTTRVSDAILLDKSLVDGKKYLLVEINCTSTSYIDYVEFLTDKNPVEITPEPEPTPTPTPTPTPNTDADAKSNADTNVKSNGNTNTDADANTNTKSNTDAKSNTNAKSNADTNAKSNTNTNVNTDADAKSNAKSDANTGTNTAAYEIQN